MVSDRGLLVLRAIVSDYVASSEPVGSKAIVDRHAFGVSSATIRNDMALLEDEGLIVAPHTSSGRVPTDKGYRIFVDRLRDGATLTNAQRQAVQRFLGEAIDLDDVLQRTVRLLSHLTQQVAIVEVPSLARTTVRRVELVALGGTRVLQVLISDAGRVEQQVVDTGVVLEHDTVQAVGAAFNEALVGRTLSSAEGELSRLVTESPEPIRDAVERLTHALSEQLGGERAERLVVAGAGHLVRAERDFTGSLEQVIDAIEEQVTLLRLMGELRADAEGVATSIGTEHPGGLEETSIVTSPYAAGRGGGTLGVLGPTRMDYAGNIAAVRAVARYLSKLLGED